MDLNKDSFENACHVLEKAAESLGAHMTLVHTRNHPVLTLSDQDQAAATPTSSTETNLPNMNALSLQETKSSVNATEDIHFFGHALLRKHATEAKDILELRVCVVGNVDAGKSTVLGVLTKNVWDDGRGKARVNLFRHKHEIESGRTSSVGMEIMGFDSRGSVITPAMLQKPKLAWEDICGVASKVITYLDLAGHEKYLKTTVFGMTGCSPDYVMLM